MKDFSNYVRPYDLFELVSRKISQDIEEVLTSGILPGEEEQKELELDSVSNYQHKQILPESFTDEEYEELIKLLFDEDDKWKDVPII